MNDCQRRRIRPDIDSQRRRRRHFAALASRVLPLAVLGLGCLIWMTSMDSALGQYQQTQYPNSPMPYTGGQSNPGAQANTRVQSNPGGAAFQTASQRMPAAAPSIPSLETDASAANAAADESSEQDSESEGWQAPGFLQKIAQGGWLMIPLGLCSLVVITLSLERLIALRRSRVIPKPFVHRFTECVEDGQLSYDEATELCEEFDCPVAEVFRAAVRRWGRPMFEVEQAVMDAGDRVSESLKRFLRVFHAISNVAPLLGLLGTVLGMIEAFETISGQESLGRPEMLASGISVALITTAGGLAVAIPAYLAYMYFSSKSDNYLHEIDRLCQRVVDCISAEGLEDAESSQRSNRKRRAA